MSEPKRMGRAVVEMAVIVFSVLLAFVLEDVRQGMEDRERAEQSLEAILAELGGNDLLIQDRLPYHRRLRDSLQVVSGRALQSRGAAELPPLNRMGFDSGMRTSPALLSAAWEGAVSTNVVRDMDFELALRLRKLYGTVEELKNVEAVALEGLRAYTRAITEGVEPRFGVLSFRMALEDLVLREGEICRSYREVLETLSASESPIDLSPC